MNIKILVNNLNVCGGTHKQVLRLAQYLIKKDYNVEIDTHCYEINKTYPGFAEIKVHHLTSEMNKKNNLRQGILTKIKNAIDMATVIAKDADVINIHDNSMYLETIFTRLLCGKKTKFVWQINDLPACFCVGVNREQKDSLKLKLKRIYMHLVAKCVDEITVNVTKNGELVEQCFGRKAKVFYCGVDVNEKLEKHSYNIKDNTVKILSSGVFYPYRNYETLVDVVENLKNKNINVHLDIIGATDRAQSYSDKIKNLVKEKDLENEITIWGQVDDSKYVELHNEADMFAFININQSWGLAVFEAMSCGLPVIVSESVGAIELLHHNEDAIIVDPENTEEISNVVLKLMNDKEYYNKISENAYNAVKEFTWDKLYSERMLELFEQLTQ